MVDNASFQRYLQSPVALKNTTAFLSYLKAFKAGEEPIIPEAAHDALESALYYNLTRLRAPQKLPPIPSRPFSKGQLKGSMAFAASLGATTFITAIILSLSLPSLSAVFGIVVCIAAISLLYLGITMIDAYGSKPGSTLPNAGAANPLTFFAKSAQKEVSDYQPVGNFL